MIEGMAERPRLLSVEAIVVREEDHDVVALRDPLHGTDAVLVVSPEAFFLLARFDGTRDVREVQSEFMRETGRLVPAADIEKVLAAADEAYFLDNERSRSHRAQVRAEYASLAVRPAAFAGDAYPAEPLELRAFLSACAEGAAKLPDDAVHAGEAAARIILPAGFERPVHSPASGRVRGLIAPHIAPQRGGAAMAKGYALLAAEPADRYVLFGTAHGECGRPYAPTRKDYETPLGRARTDRGVVESLADSLGEGILSDEFAHRSEHSLEFQVLFLQHALGRSDVPIVPILCGALAADDTAGDPAADPAVAGFHFALAGALAAAGGRTVFVAGADLSHVGLRFGDAAAPDVSALAEVEAHDRALLAAAAAGDASAFHTAIRRDRDRHRICGHAPIWAALRACAGAEGRLLRYEQSVERESGSVVTFAALALTDRP